MQQFWLAASWVVVAIFSGSIGYAVGCSRRTQTQRSGDNSVSIQVGHRDPR